MQKLLYSLTQIGAEVMTQYAARGGVIRFGESIVSQEVMSSLPGMLTPMLWMAAQFSRDFQVEFPEVRYSRSSTGLTGFSATEVTPINSGAVSVFAFADFLRNELVPVHVADLDMTPMVRAFKEWAHENVPTDAAESVLTM